MKNKNVTGILALLGGMIGVHRFYLGQKGLGIVYFLATFIGIMLTAESNGDFPLILAPMAIGFMDAVLFFVMPQEDFDEKYNKKRVRKAERRKNSKSGFDKAPKEFSVAPPVKKVVQDPYKRIGIEKFRDFNFLGAIEAFQKSLKKNYESPSTHFNLACSYSMLELPKDAFFHLEKAIEFGFNAFEKIQSHQALSFLRVQPEFEQFVKSGYKIATPGISPEEEEDKLDLNPLPSPSNPQIDKTNDLLDQILQLGELREKGLLSDEEFNAQKQKLLRD